MGSCKTIQYSFGLPLKGRQIHNSGRVDWQPAAPCRCIQVSRTRWILSKLAKVLSKPHFSSVMADRGGPSRLEIGQRDTHLQAGPEGGSGKLQAHKFNFGARTGHGAHHPEYHWEAHTGQLELKVVV